MIHLQGIKLVNKFLETIWKERDAIEILNTLDPKVVKDVVDILTEAQGVIRVVGVGKSALVAKKFADTMASIGYVVEFNTAEDLAHGGLGKLQTLDVVIFISKSGNTSELSPALDFCCANRIGFICVMCDIPPETKLMENRVGNGYVRRNRFHWVCANYMGYLVTLPNTKEADPYDVIPTSSYAMMNAFFDGIAMEMFGNISKENIVAMHPGGTFGKS